MITQYTKDLIKERGWKFVPSHDIRSPQGFSEIVIPESWVHEYKDYPVQWSVEDVLEIINDEIELEIESNLR